MELPCTTCKFKTVVTRGHRSFYGCNDEEKKKKNFHEDTWTYRHSCDAYEAELKVGE